MAIDFPNSRHLFPLRKTKVLRYWTRSPNKYLTSSNGILSEALSHNTSSQCNCIKSLLTIPMKLESQITRSHDEFMQV